MLDASAFTCLRFELDGPIGILTLHRPEQRNAWTLRMALELGAMMRAIDASNDIRALVVTGAGSTFSVGAELGSGSILRPGGDDDSLELPDEPTMLPSGLRIPVIAAINGSAAGAGINYAMHCDIRILADTARVAFAFVRRGVIPEMGMHWLLPRVVGLGVATDVLLSGRTMYAEEVLRLGLVHHVRPAAEVLSTAIEMAKEIARTAAPLSVAVTKRLLYAGLDEQWQQARRTETERFAWCAELPDAVEGVDSFLERRDARWSGSLEDLPE
jgi:enoyl-CoA hydratase/carnithine racemase